MKKILLLLLLVCFIGGCGDKKEEKAPEKTTTNTHQMQGGVDVGKFEHVSVFVTGIGATPGAAVNEALKSAIAQVNGVRIESNSAQVNVFAQSTATLDIETSQGSDTAKASAIIQGNAFAETIVAQSQGLVSSFRVIKIIQPKRENKNYTIEIEAKIAKFEAPADAGKIRIVVAPLRSKTKTFDIGGRAVSANEILSSIQHQLIDALSQTGRFTVLDRQFEEELQNELNMINSGQTTNNDFAKLGQALGADLVWVGIVNNLGYSKNVRKIETSDRNLVSYSGGWSVSQRMINLATRQILQSNTLHGKPLSIAPTTLGTGFNENETLKSMQNEIVKKAVAAIISQTFPISIVRIDGNNVVLSQGGQAVSEKSRYMVYLLGEEFKDPQTGQSLGREEKVCCEVLINRVTPNLSYGVLENIQIDLSKATTGALQIRELLPVKSQRQVTEKKKEPTKTADIAGKPKTKAPKAASSSTKAKDDDW